MMNHYRTAVGKKKERNASKFVTRENALKQLEMSLPLFRNLCIWEGITPRFKGTDKAYYYSVKDIKFLYRVRVRELRRAKRDNARIDMLLQGRYPISFVDTLGGLYNCLSMVHLFATVPATDSKKIKIDVERIHNCQRLAHEWQAFVSRTHKLRKTFVSVEGIYYQAEVKGQTITWLNPHSLQHVVSDVDDIPAMLNMLHTYECLLGFVYLNLYDSLNLKYPPMLDPCSDASAADANTRPAILNSEALQLVESEQMESKKDGADTQNKKSERSLAQLPSNEPGTLMQLVEEVAGKDGEEYDQETRECKYLFKNVKIFLSREVPRESLLFVIHAFGGTVSWEGDGAPFGESDQSITHQIVDREAQGHGFLSREYVQPQWVFDCVNARIILPAENYIVGRIPPPHLSPFVGDDGGAYVPEYAKTLKHVLAAVRKEMQEMMNGEQ